MDIGDLYVELLRGTPTDQQSMYAQEPVYAYGQNLMRTQFQPRNNTEALLLPLAQGLIGGALASWGKSKAEDTAFENIRKSPLLSLLQEDQNVGPVASGSEYAQSMGLADALQNYASPNRPEGWTAKEGRDSLVLAAIKAQDEHEKQKLREKLQDQFKLTELEYNLKNSPAAMEREAQAAGLKAGAEAQAKKNVEVGSFTPTEAPEGGLDPAIVSKLPAKFQDNALKEVDQFNKDTKAKTYINQAFDRAKEISSFSTLNPASTEGAELKALPVTLISSIKELLGEKKFSDADARMIQPLLPSEWDTKSQLEGKRIALNNWLDGKRSYPLLQKLNPGILENPGAGAKLEAPPPPLPGESKAEYKARIGR